MDAHTADVIAVACGIVFMAIIFLLVATGHANYVGLSCSGLNCS